MADYISLLLSGLSSSFSYAFLGLLIGIIVVIALKKLKLLDRGHIVLKIVVKFWYLLIPFAFFLFLWFSGSILYTKKQLTLAIDHAFEQAKEELYPQLSAFIDENIHDYIERQELPSNKEIVNYFFAKSTTQANSGIAKYSLKLVSIT